MIEQKQARILSMAGDENKKNLYYRRHDAEPEQQRTRAESWLEKNLLKLKTCGSNNIV
jgi:hypothetical protein